MIEPGGLHLQLTLSHEKQFRLDVNLSLPSRGVSAITGSSGAGKTTFLRAVAGLEPGVRGRVEINSEVWQDDAQGIFLPTHKRPVGYVFQEANLFSHLSVKQNLEFGLRRIPVADQKIAVAHVVELLGIGPLLNRFPSTLSGGEKQRVGIARALATSPRLILMDEPLASLDEQRKAEIFPYLERLHKELEIPILYVSHRSDEIARLADHVVILEKGRVSAVGEVNQIALRSDLYGDPTFSIIAATVIAHDDHYQLTEVAFSGGALWLPKRDISIAIAIGAEVRLRIFARDVSLSKTRPTDSSILNSLKVKINAIHNDAPGLLLMELDAVDTKLLACITRKSADQLDLRIGMTIFAQIKGAAMHCVGSA